MPWIAGAIGGSAILGAFASNSAANTQASAANNANAMQMQMFNQTQANQQPWLQAGGTAVSQMGQMTQPGSAYTTPFTNADLNSNLAPNYAWQLQQGQNALTNQMSTMGGIGGNAMKGMQDYTQNTAANAYQQAYENYNTSQTNIFNRLASIAGLGQTSANTGSQVGAQTGQSMAGTTTGGAAAQAAGTIGVANAIGGGVNSAIGWNYLNSLNSNNPANFTPSAQATADFAAQG